MPATALTFALTAAVLHAGWNLLLARAPDVESAAVVALLTAEVAFAPVVVVVWRADAGVWPWLVGSGLFETAYFALLVAAYRRAPLSVVYPVARGGAPVLVLAISVLVLGRATSWSQGGGVALVVCGVLLVRGIVDVDGRGVLFGLAIAGCICGYTLIDKQGIRHAGPLPYLELSMLGPTLLYAAAVLKLRGTAAVRAAARPPAFAAGLSTFAAYAFVLAALARASAASVAAVRETSVVLATALAAAVLRERVGVTRVAGAVLVVAGIALLA
jgi:drug/metabolite transporter (DMT)-like permease